LDFISVLMENQDIDLNRQKFPERQTMRTVHCTWDRHAQPILAIFNEAIAHSTALFDYKPRPLESMLGWFKTKEAGGFPVLGIESEQAELLGFASYGTFRAWPAYKYSIEHSIYVHQRHRGKGLGKALLQALIVEATRQNYHLLVGGIEASNAASIALHESQGFTHAGTIHHAGYKFGRWLDLSFYELLLPTPVSPSEV
jgi:L-amino acid N-acyltransferase